MYLVYKLLRYLSDFRSAVWIMPYAFTRGDYGDRIGCCRTIVGSCIGIGRLFVDEVRIAGRALPLW